MEFAKIKTPKEITTSSSVTSGCPSRPLKKLGVNRNLKKITQSYYVIALRNLLKYLAKRDIASLPR